MHFIKHHAPHPRFHEQTKELIAGCDPDFDAIYDDLERMIHGNRISRETLE